MTCGDMAVVEMPDRYRLVYVVFNSLMNLLTQDEQVQCVANAARHLTDDGVFVVARARRNWAATAIARVLRGRLPPVPAPYYLTTGRIAVNRPSRPEEIRARS